jgi:hypothetical protein
MRPLDGNVTSTLPEIVESALIADTVTDPLAEFSQLSADVCSAANPTVLPGAMDQVPIDLSGAVKIATETLGLWTTPWVNGSGVRMIWVAAPSLGAHTCLARAFGSPCGGASGPSEHAATATIAGATRAKTARRIEPLNRSAPRRSSR